MRCRTAAELNKQRCECRPVGANVAQAVSDGRLRRLIIGARIDTLGHQLTGDWR
jgi:hypothetical protein